MSFGNIRAALGEPYFETDDVLLYNGDCVTLMERLPGNTIDLTVTSPPYNIGKEYENTMPLNEYLIWCEHWINQIHRICSLAGSFWLNLGYQSVSGKAKAIPIPYLLWDRVPFFMIQEIVWHYSAGVAGRKFFSPRNEKFIWYVKNAKTYTFNLDDVRDPNVKYPNQKKNGKIKVNSLGKNPSDVWEIPKVTSGKNRASKERTPHPAQFPEAVIQRIIKASSNPCDIVLDPFLGSGTTAVVAAKLGRKTIGFEINREYCELAIERLESYLKNDRLLL